MDIEYCFEKCPIGKVASEVFLKIQNSAFDAALDFGTFTENCFKTCPYQSLHENKNNAVY